MSDHAATIRTGILAPDREAGGEVVIDALAALGALVAENQRLREALEAVDTHQRRLRIDQGRGLQAHISAALDGTP